MRPIRAVCLRFESLTFYHVWKIRTSFSRHGGDLVSLVSRIYQDHGGRQKLEGLKVESSLFATSMMYQEHAQPFGTLQCMHRMMEDQQCKDDLQTVIISEAWSIRLSMTRTRHLQSKPSVYFAITQLEPCITVRSALVSSIHDRLSSLCHLSGQASLYMKLQPYPSTKHQE